MKTVLQELFEQLEKTIPQMKNGNATEKNYWLEKEKRQIQEAFVAGSWDTSGIQDENEMSNYYYQETFIRSYEAGI